MFRKTEGEYNPKIDFKLLYFLNPKLDKTKNYNEVVDIFKKKNKFISEQGKWFSKVSAVFNYLLENKFLCKETFNFIAKQFETTVEYKIMEGIISQHLEIGSEDVPYEATWLLRAIMYERPFKEYSDTIAVIMFNAFLKIYGYIPIIFLDDYFKFIKRMIESGITVQSLKDLLSIYKDLSFKYEKKYEKLSKQDIITTIARNKNELVQKHGVKAIWLYGSFVREEANAYSDIDLYVSFDEKKSQEHLINTKKYLEELLGRSVDMSLDSKANQDFATNVLKEREVIFDDR